MHMYRSIRINNIIKFPMNLFAANALSSEEGKFDIVVLKAFFSLSLLHAYLEAEEANLIGLYTHAV